MSRGSQKATTVPAPAGTAFRLLGPLEVVHRGVVRDVPAGRQQALLAALLLRPNEVVSAPTLVEQVWGGREGADRSVLNVCVMRLRRSLQDHDHVVLRAENGGYRVAVNESAVDLYRFRQLCVEARQARERGAPEVERTKLHEALALWRGEAFAGVSSASIQSEVVPIVNEERLGAIERRVGADLECGAHAEVIRELRGLVADHPFRERFWHELMLALYRSGRQSEALDAYRTVRGIFTDDLGVEPGVELRDLQRRILTEDPALLVPTASPAIEASGSVAYVPVVPAQLPPAVGGFSGRQGHLHELDRLLAQADTAAPIALITGAPGVGKTVLAVHWAGRLRDRYPDGQLYVDLRGYAREPPTRPIEALTHFLRTTGLPANQIPTDLTTAACLFRSLTTGKRMLVLLDNAVSADQVRPLLPGGQDCVVVVTSRDQLTGLVAREGARQFVVDVLSDTEAQALLAAVLGHERLAAEPEMASELAQACGNLPLALRIAAANLANHPDQSVADYVTELRAGDRLDVLQVAGDDQSAVRAAFRLSYSSLAPAVRRMFKLLGLFPGTEISSDAAGALADITPPEARRLLDQLTSAHLVSPRGSDRLVFHDLLRLYATEVAHEEDTDQDRESATQRLYDHYTRTVEAAIRRMYPKTLRLPLPAEVARVPVEFDDHSQASDWLDAERANLVAAVQYAAVHGPRLDACRLAAALRGYLHIRQHIVDWLPIARAGLVAARTIGDPRAQATAHLSLADWHRSQGKYRTSVKHYERVLALSRYDGWIEGQAAAHNNLGNVYRLTGRLRPAADQLVRALALNRQAGRIAGQAASLGNLGRTLLQMGQVADAVSSLQQSLILNHRIGARGPVSRSLSSLGEALNALGDHDRARDCLHRALALQQEMDDRQFLPFTLCDLAAVYLDTGEHVRALELARTALTLSREVGRQHAEAGAIRVLAAVDRSLGRHDSALERYRHSLDLARKTDLWYLHVQTLIGLATTYLDLDQSGQARRYADRAIDLASRFGYQLLERQAVAVRSDVLSARYRSPAQ